MFSTCPSSLLACCGWLFGACYDVEEIGPGSPVPGAFALVGGNSAGCTFSHGLPAGIFGIVQITPHSACRRSWGHASPVGGGLVCEGRNTFLDMPRTCMIKRHPQLWSAQNCCPAWLTDNTQGEHISSTVTVQLNQMYIIVQF